MQPLTHTVDSCVVQVVPKGTLAAEGPVSVNAGSVYADTQVLRALVNIYKGNQGNETSCEKHIPVLSGVTLQSQILPLCRAGG